MPESEYYVMRPWSGEVDELTERLAELAAAGPDAFDRTDDEWFLLVGRSEARFADRPLPVDGNGDQLPDDGCQGEAVRTLSGGLSPDWQSRNDDSGPRAAADPRVRAAEAAWSERMAAAGYDYQSIWEPNDQDWPEPPNRKEIATAIADVDCKIETNLVGVWVGVMAEYQEQYIQQNWTELQELKRWLETVNRNSARVLAEARD